MGRTLRLQVVFPSSNLHPPVFGTTDDFCLIQPLLWRLPSVFTGWFSTENTCLPSSPCIYLLLHLFISVCTHGSIPIQWILFIYFFQWILFLNFFFFEIQIVLDMASGTPFKRASQSFWYVPILWLIPYFLAWDVPDSFCTFSVPALESCISQGILISFSRGGI